MSTLFPALISPGDRQAERGRHDDDVSRLAAAAGGLARELAGTRRVAVVATPTLETIVAVVGALAAGAAVVPINPTSAAPEIDHIVADSSPDAVVSAESALPPSLLGRRRVEPRAAVGRYDEASSSNPERTALNSLHLRDNRAPKGVQIPLFRDRDQSGRAVRCMAVDRS